MKMIFSIVTMMCFIGAAFGADPSAAPVSRAPTPYPSAASEITWPKDKLKDPSSPLPDTDRYLPIDRLQVRTFFSSIGGEPHPPRTRTPLTFPPTCAPLLTLQWNNNGGYCGETSFQLALLDAGTWASQYTIREVVNAKKQSFADFNKRLPQQQQFLLSVNDLTTATGMNINATQYMASPDSGPGGNTDTTVFLAWVKKQVLQFIFCTFCCHVSFAQCRRCLFFSDAHRHRRCARAQGCPSA